MTQDKALQLIQSLPDDRLPLFAEQLAAFLVADLNASAEEPPPAFTESRARALLRSADVAGDPVLRDFAGLLEQPPAQRVALYDLLGDAGLVDLEALEGLAAFGAASAAARPAEWAALVVWQPVPALPVRLDPPPERTVCRTRPAPQYMRRQGAGRDGRSWPPAGYQPRQAAGLSEWRIRPSPLCRRTRSCRSAIRGAANAAQRSRQRARLFRPSGEPLTISEEELPPGASQNACRPSPFRASRWSRLAAQPGAGRRARAASQLAVWPERGAAADVRQ